jgi:hypothetical protein
MTDEALCNALRYEKWDEAADRIEVLTAKLAKVAKQISDWEVRIDLCEWSENTSLTSDVRKEMRATVAEIKGKKG